MKRDRLSADELRRLDLDQVHDYVRAAGWQPLPGAGRGLVTVYERPETRLKQVQVPVRRDLDDLDFVLAQMVEWLAEWEKRSPADVFDDLRFYTIDILEFRERSPAAANGALPFLRARDMFAGIANSLAWAAHAVTCFQAGHPCQEMPEPRPFLDHCQFGQTKADSFAMTVNCPLDGLSLRGPRFDREPFARQVTGHLMAALRILAEAQERGDVAAVLRAVETEPALSANLCEALRDLAPQGDESSLEVTAHWARKLPPAEGLDRPRSVTLPRRAFDFIEGLAGRLVSHRVPEAKEVFFGSVEATSS